MSYEQQGGNFGGSGCDGQQQQFAPSPTHQLGAGTQSDVLQPLFTEKVKAAPVYQQLTFLGIAKQVNDGHEVQGPNHAEALIARSMNDGAQLHAMAYRPIGNSGRADLIAVFEGPFNQAQQAYLHDIRKVAIPAMDPDLKDVKPWDSGSRPGATETQHSFAYLLPD